MSLRASDASRPHVAALGALAVLAAAGVVATYVLWVRTRAGQQPDQDAFDGRAIFRDARSAAGDLLWTISIGSLVLAICVLAAFAFVRHRRTLALVATVAIGGAVLTTEVLQRFVFERPALLDSARDFHNSYPSGHTTIAYAVGIAATIVAPRRAPPGRGRRRLPLRDGNRPLHGPGRMAPAQRRGRRSPRRNGMGGGDGRRPHPR
jgi:hypothetical protein